ncbi:unnamed protein product [Rotaria socialis]|uniref:Uncharacterized protein n=1 Tax=Rotaria socialis TaxID=392032 RepID=A0A818WZ23_9BILA|nr:unnamed protein product [Rotaria socialis]CAF4652207.1 unnamed protein product [Rotaria socialis]
MLNVDFIQIYKIENNDCPTRSIILSSTQNIQAFLVQDEYHYYCIRQFRLTEDYFFKIDYKYPMYREPIHHQDILAFIGTLLECRCNVYITIQHVNDHFDEDLSIQNIATKLWALPDSPADLEA